MKGKYFIIEGGEGCGKSTQAEMLYNFLISKNIPCHLGREPGGIEFAEKIRDLVKDPKYNICPTTELFCFEAPRSEFFDKIVIPKLKEGINIISDRSGYSTIAYQGFGGGLDVNRIREMNHIATRGIQPDLAFIIDINPETGLGKEVVKDRFFAKGLEYHKNVRKGFLAIAKEYPKICRIINYIPNGKDEMHRQIRDSIMDLFLSQYLEKNK